MIIGGSKIGFYLSKLLVSSGIGVKLIDKDRDQCERLNESIPDAMIIHGNGNDHDMLLEEGLTDVDAFIALRITMRRICSCLCMHRARVMQNWSQRYRN